MTYPNPEHPPTRDGLALTSLALGTIALLTYLLIPLSFTCALIGLLLGIASHINYRNTISKVAVSLNAFGLILTILFTFVGCSALFV